MVEVTKKNFWSILNDFEHDIKKCSFFAIDCEFTSLATDFIAKEERSFLDSPSDRYIKIKNNIGTSLIVQIGITPFRYYRDLNYYKAFPYNFFIFPKSFGSYNPFISFTATTVHFLGDSQLDFNKVFKDGISFMNNTNIQIIKKEMRDGTLLNKIEENLSYSEIDEILGNCETIRKWISSSEGNAYELPCKENNPSYSYALNQEIRKLSKNIWSSEKNNQIIVTKVNPEERMKLENNDELQSEKDLIDILRGFSKIFEILYLSKKPLVGHNLFLDLLTLYSQFYEDLPDSYSQYKKKINHLFPHVYDTKYISKMLQRQLETTWEKGEGMKTALGKVYNSYQDNGTMFYFPRIELEPKGIYHEVCNQHAHDAGWDSYMTGFVFLKMADEFARIRKNETHLVNVTFTELLASLKEYENNISIARCNITYLNLAGDDPVSRRPPLLHVQYFNKQNLTTIELDAAFKKYEPIYKRKLNVHSALISTPNFRCFKNILVDFSNSKEFKVEKYSLIRHHRGIQACLVAGILLPVVVTIWFGVLK